MLRIRDPGREPLVTVYVVEVRMEQRGLATRRRVVILDVIAVATGRYEVERVHADGREAALGHDVVELADIAVSAHGTPLILCGVLERVVYRATWPTLIGHAACIDPLGRVLVIDAWHLEVARFERMQRAVGGGVEVQAGSPVYSRRRFVQPSTPPLLTVLCDA
ncbi:hypothetical protein [Streptomyces virginiae]|uniref:hypothetical protein n=1 Tax=Streptomyces virginiae TaxID=1961 RepID=UPI00344204FD